MVLSLIAMHHSSGVRTLRPFKAFSKAGPLHPTLPKILASSGACTFPIFLPTRCWRRKWTSLATKQCQESKPRWKANMMALTFSDLRHLVAVYGVQMVDKSHRIVDAIQARRWMT